MTYKRLENIALYYLERYSSSSANLRTVLKRRLRKEAMKEAQIPEEAPQWIDAIVARMVELGYVNDELYKENLVRQLRAQGKSNRQIRLKMMEKGVPGELEADADDEYAQALIFIRKKKLGFYRGKAQAEFKQKDMQKLALAGFSYDVSRRVLDLEEEP